MIANINYTKQINKNKGKTVSSWKYLHAEQNTQSLLVADFTCYSIWLEVGSGIASDLIDNVCTYHLIAAIFSLKHGNVIALKKGLFGHISPVRSIIL